MEEIKRRYFAGEINRADAATALRDYHECIFTRLGILDRWDKEIAVVDDLIYKRK